MIYRELLPDGCPPIESTEVVDECVVFRLVDSKPPTGDDFRSQRAERPNAIFPPGISECIARGISVHTERNDSEKLRRLPRFRRALLCRVRLTAGAGRIQQTFQPSHHTWWPLAALDILAECEIETT
jgi:hypothetical protein